MRDKFNKFMQGRYGVDAFARFTMGVALVAIIISIFFPGGNRIGALFDTIGLLVLLYTYYRMLSRDIQKRYAENEKYLAATAKFRQRFNREKNMMNQRKTQDRDHDDQWDRSKNTFENILCHTFFSFCFLFLSPKSGTLRLFQKNSALIINSV